MAQTVKLQTEALVQEMKKPRYRRIPGTRYADSVVEAKTSKILTVQTPTAIL